MRESEVEVTRVVVVIWVVPHSVTEGIGVHAIVYYIGGEVERRCSRSIEGTPHPVDALAFHVPFLAHQRLVPLDIKGTKDPFYPEGAYNRKDR